MPVLLLVNVAVLPLTAMEKAALGPAGGGVGVGLLIGVGVGPVGGVGVGPGGVVGVGVAMPKLGVGVEKPGVDVSGTNEKRIGVGEGSGVAAGVGVSWTKIGSDDPGEDVSVAPIRPGFCGGVDR